VFLLPAVLLAVGCGNDDGSGDGGGAVTLKGGQPLTVSGDEYSFDPATVVLEGAGELRIRLENDGTLAHNLKLVRDDTEVGGTASLPAGDTGSATVRVSSGRYEMVCTVGDHAELGMTGELQVKD
jgi:plastocyanin